MSCLSKNTLDDIKRFCADKGLRHVSGAHVNGDSKHDVICLSCGLPDIKTSKTLASRTKGTCRYLPCAPKGVLTLQFLQAIAAEQGGSLRSVPATDRADEVSRDAILEFSRPSSDGGTPEIMRECWGTLLERLKTKRSFFVPEHSRRRSRSILTVAEATAICASANLKFVGPEVASRASPLPMECVDCGLPQKHAIQTVESPTFLGCVCKRALNRFGKLARMVEAQGFELADPEETKHAFLKVAREEPDYVDKGTRKIRPKLRCGGCKKVGYFQTCSEIIHEHLLHCGNKKSCPDARQKRQRSERFDFARTDAAIAHNIALLDKEFGSLAELRETEPYTYYRFKSGPSGPVTTWRNRIFDGVEQRNPGWRGRKRAMPALDEIRRIIRVGMDAGAKSGVHALRDSLSAADQLVLADALSLASPSFKQCAEELSYPIKQFFKNMTAEEVVEHLKAKNLTSAGALRLYEPGLQQYLRRNQMTDEVYSSMGWSPPVVYLEMSDDELVDKACELATEYQVTQSALCNLSIMEYRISSALVREVRSRALQYAVVAQMGWETTYRWQSMSPEDIDAVIAERMIFSLSDLHGTLSGCYKELVRRNALDDVAKRHGWEIPRSLSGHRCYSRIECVTMSLLDLNDIPYTSSPRIWEFPGRKGGAVKADILLYGSRIVEIWAMPADGLGTGYFRGYAENRCYKEAQYKISHPDYISIEGLAFYKKLPALELQEPGLEGFLGYLVWAFGQQGVSIRVDAKMIRDIRAHLATAYDVTTTTQDTV